MRKIFLILFLFLTFGCASTVDNNRTGLVFENNIKVSYSDSNTIILIIGKIGNMRQTEPSLKFKSAAKKYCTSLKKNTYYLRYSVGEPSKYYNWEKSFKMYDMGGYEKPGIWNWGYRFNCFANIQEAKEYTNNVLKEFHKKSSDKRGMPKYIFADGSYFSPLGSGYIKQIRYDIYEIKRDLSAQEIAENKARAEQERLAKIEKEKKLAEIARKQKLASLELSYSEACTDGMFKKGFVKGTKEYEQCLFDKDREAIAKQKALDEKLAKMSPVQRREFNCENAFKFKPGTNDFNQCVFKLYTTELELEKLELQKQVALANERAAKAQAKAAENEKARADAVAKAQIAAADAQKAAANSASLANSISLMQLGSSMMSGSSSSSSGMNSMGRVRTTCRNVGGFLNCY